ncbi:MAG TPA: PEP-CTERM sorting domain-containing protein [Terriglobales bacterium]|nr:PEP-CTERM sorting domain-containing protein [Terriglobales bacterium]
MSFTRFSPAWFLLLLILPTSVWANSVRWQNVGGQITASGNAVSLNGSTMSGVVSSTSSGLSGDSFSFTTGPLVSGSLSGGGTFAAGGSISISGTGSNGLPVGVLFRGTFTGPATWTATWNPNAGPNHDGRWYYSLTGSFAGTLSNGQRVSGTLTEDTFDVPGGKSFDTAVNLNNGVLSISVPEPETLSLMCTGLLAIGAFIRRQTLR